MCEIPGGEFLMAFFMIFGAIVMHCIYRVFVVIPLEEELEGIRTAVHAYIKIYGEMARVSRGEGILGCERRMLRILFPEEIASDSEDKDT